MKSVYNALSEKQKTALRFVGRYTARFGRAPTYRELADVLYPDSETLPSFLVGELRRKGYLSRLRRRHRILALTPMGKIWFIRDDLAEKEGWLPIDFNGH
jgi:hypothetical protein